MQEPGKLEKSDAKCQLIASPTKLDNLILDKPKLEINSPDETKVEPSKEPTSNEPKMGKLCDTKILEIKLPFSRMLNITII